MTAATTPEIAVASPAREFAEINRDVPKKADAFLVDDLALLSDLTKTLIDHVEHVKQRQDGG